MRTGSKDFLLLSIRNRILLFAVLATLLPSFGLGWAYFTQTERALLESSQRELLGTLNHVRREFGLWFKDRYYDIRVFSNSYLLSEGLGEFLAPDGNGPAGKSGDADTQLTKLETYLSLVRSQFSFYERLLVFDRRGELLIQNPQHTGSLELPGNWQKQLETQKVIVGEVYLSRRSVPSVLAAVPILSGDGTVLGYLAAEIKLDALAKIMTSFIGKTDFHAGSTELLLVGHGGRVLLSTGEHMDEALRTQMHEAALRPHELSEYVNTQGVPVVGILAPISEISLSLVMEKHQDQVFSEVIELRNKTLLGVVVLVALIGLFAYLISRGIISPLERLTDAAGKVAEGDLDVNIPVERHDELGTTTQVFNDMVGQLRQSRERLEQLSTTDSLTQLANRKHIMERLTAHLERFRRNGTSFSVMLVDADHFKRINDSNGHVVGDKVLRRLGETFQRLLRTVDVAGRYGGEEFLIVLDETRGAEALQTAERIRLAIESSEVNIAGFTIRFTVSIGVAEIAPGEDEDQLIARADAALYRAKREGRNRSLLARQPNAKVAHHPAVRKIDGS